MLDLSDHGAEQKAPKTYGRRVHGYYKKTNE